MHKLLVVLTLAMSLVACGARSLGNKVDDQLIHPSVINAVRAAHPDLSRPTTHLVVTSYNGIVLLAGQTPRADLKAMATRAAQSIEGVKKVHNELEVASPAPLHLRSNDALLTSKVKSRLIVETDVPSTKVKVVTVNGTLYLLGVVSRTEADNITQSALHVGGIQKIVRLFEYIN